MRPSHKFGIASFGCGTLALLLAFVATYAHSIRDWNNWFIFDLAEHVGLLRQDKHTPATFTSFNVFSINEANAITWTYFAAVTLAIISILAALRAEAKGEGSLYLSGGFICAALSIGIYR